MIIFWLKKKDTSLNQRGVSSLIQRRVFFRYQNLAYIGIIFNFESFETQSGFRFRFQHFFLTQKWYFFFLTHLAEFFFVVWSQGTKKAFFWPKFAISRVSYRKKWNFQPAQLNLEKREPFARYLNFNNPS